MLESITQGKPNTSEGRARVITGIIRAEAVRYVYGDAKTKREISDGFHITARLLGRGLDEYHEYMNLFDKEIAKLEREDGDRAS